MTVAVFSAVITLVVLAILAYSLVWR